MALYHCFLKKTPLVFEGKYSYYIKGAALMREDRDKWRRSVASRPLPSELTMVLKKKKKKKKKKKTVIPL